MKTFLLLAIPLLLFRCSQNDSVLIHTEIDLIKRFDRATIHAASNEHVYQQFKDVLIHRDYRWSLFSHPDSSIEFNRLNIETKAILDFYIGIDERAWDNKKEENRSDGVEFIIYEQNGNPIFSEYLNPRDKKEHRGWQNRKIELKASVDQPLSTLTFATKGGESQTSDWAYWGTPRIILDGKPVQHRSHDQMNVILISLDTLRSDYLSSYGNTWIDTPHIESVASKGVLFEHVYATSSTTSPSHVSMFTSTYPYTHGVINNEYQLGHKIPTLTQILKEKEYKTGAAVSVIHLHEKICGLGNYFDYYYQTKATEASDKWQLINSGYSTVSAGIEFMEGSHNDPFFLFLHLYDAHMPYLPPAGYDRLYYEGDPKDSAHDSMKNASFMNNFAYHIETWMHGITDLEYFKKQYGAEIRYVDDQVGRVLEALKRLKIDQNTMIVITGDHGEALGENGIYFNHWTLHEPEIKVPMIVYYPGIQIENKRVDKRISIIDVAPTVLDVLGIKNNVIAEDMFYGKSLKPIWEDEPFDRRYILANSLNYIQTAYIGDRYKVNWVLRDAIYNIKKRLPKDRVLVYDLMDDPNEEHPVASFIWLKDVGELQRLHPDLSKHERMQTYKKNAERKAVPSIDELKQWCTQNKPNHFIDADLVGDDAFFEEVRFALQTLLDQLHEDLKDRLVNVLDLSGLQQLEMESMSIDDPNFLEQMKSLGYSN